MSFVRAFLVQSALLTLTTRELFRRGWFLALFAAQVLWLAAYPVFGPAEATERAAANYLAHALGGLEVLILIGGVTVAAGGISGARTDERHQRVGASLLSAGAWFGGRALGLAIALSLAGLLLAVPVGTVFLARFGGLSGAIDLHQPLVPLASPLSGHGVVLRRSGEGLDLDLPGPKTTGSRVLAGQLRTRVMRVAADGPSRSRFPVVFQIGATGQPGTSRHTMLLSASRPSSFEFDLPSSLAEATRLPVRVELVDPRIRLQVGPDDLRFEGASRSLGAELLRGGWIAGFHAAAMAILVHAVFCIWSRATALLAALGLAALSSGFDVFAQSLFTGLSAEWRASLSAVVAFMVPILENHDPARSLGRGMALGWSPVLSLGLRCLGSGLVLGLGIGLRGRLRRSRA